MPRFRFVLPVAALALLASCKSTNDLQAALTVKRSSCPAVGLPAYTNDVTLFDPPAARTADAIDVVASVQDLRSSCNEADPSSANITDTASFTVAARRSHTQGARDVTLPYYAVVVRGGRNVTSKTLGQVTLHFADGQALAQANAQATISVNRAAATLPERVVQRINRKRRPGDIDAAVDPLSDPQVRAAVQRASFELLIGFQLTDDQLRYNATR